MHRCFGVQYKNTSVNLQQLSVLDSPLYCPLEEPTIFTEFKWQIHIPERELLSISATALQYIAS